MPLRNQPYLKFFVKDWLSDDKLKDCSMASHGLLINLMGLMHQSQEYGLILLKQKYKQTHKQTHNFALQLAKQLPFSLDEIEESLGELISEGVVQLCDDALSQKRMVKDGNLSDTRALAGSKGGNNSKNKDKLANEFAQAKIQANAEYVYVYEPEDENVNNNILISVVEYLNEKTGSKYRATTAGTKRCINARINEGHDLNDFMAVIDKKADEWIGTDMQKYLRPETLFGNKFESYLNQRVDVKTAKQPQELLGTYI